MTPGLFGTARRPLFRESPEPLTLAVDGCSRRAEGIASAVRSNGFTQPTNLCGHPLPRPGCLTLQALRCRVVHWRFQALVDAYPKLGASTVEDVWEWSLNAEREIREVLGVDSDAYDTMREVRHLMRVVDIQPWRRRHKDYLTDEVFGPIRARTYTALMAAASEDQEDRMVVRVVDLHPWIAEVAEPLFDDGHRRQAIIAATQNLEKQWRELLGVATPSLSKLADESFSSSAPTPEHPRLRYPAVGTDTM